MLNNAFSKFDRDGDAKLNPEEFRSFNEILKPGIAVDRNDLPTVDYSKTMDRDSDGVVTRDEMNCTGVLMPARLTDDSLKMILNYLSLKEDPSAIAAAAILKDGLDQETNS
jgi:Ca2+-binding EF-hand superfamily protein